MFRQVVTKCGPIPFCPRPFLDDRHSSIPKQAMTHVLNGQSGLFVDGIRSHVPSTEYSHGTGNIHSSYPSSFRRPQAWSSLWCPPRLVSRYYRHGQHGHTTGHLRNERTKTPAFTEFDNLEPIPRRSGSIPLFHDTCPSSGRTIREDPQWPQIESPTYLLVVGKK